ncbi:MAG: hypothetical protein AB8B83_09840 [Bdellovibrionales bacterium]
MLTSSLHFSSLIRDNAPRLAHNSRDDFSAFLEGVKADWLALHGRRASFNWDLITEKLLEAADDLFEYGQQITSHDLLRLHEDLNIKFRSKEDDSTACSDACQIALDMAIKTQHMPAQQTDIEMVA